MNIERLKYKFGEDDQINAKLKEIVLYIGSKSLNDPKYGAVKLNKIILFSDYLSYLKYGQPITGVTYIKLPKGPVPKMIHKLLNQMIDDSELALVVGEYFDKEQKRFLPCREANLDLLNAREVAIIDTVIERFREHNGSEVSDISHDRAWRIAGMKKEIPYQAAYISDEAPTGYEIRRAKEIQGA
jgi:hypothetical protein